MYAKLQKIISFSLFLISIGLSSLCFDAGLNKLLATLPAYSPRSKQIVQQNIQYTARELGVTDTTTKFPSSLNAKAACLIDADSGMVLFAKNADEKLPMASTTKIMTALIALESSDLSDTITFSAHAASMPCPANNSRCVIYCIPCCWDLITTLQLLLQSMSVVPPKPSLTK